MTNSELKFNETVPAFLKRIAEATEKIAVELHKANKLTAFQLVESIEAGDHSADTIRDRIVALGNIMGFGMTIPDQPDGGKEGAE